MTSDKLISFMQSTTRVLWSAAALLAPWLVPVGSAILFGWAMFRAALVLGLPPFLAGVVGVATACGLETVNIAAAHAAIHLSHDRKKSGGRFWLSVSLIGVYVALGIAAMLTLPVAPEIHAIGAAMFLLTPVAITAQALALDIGRVEKHEEDKQALILARLQTTAQRDKVALEIEAQKIALEFKVLEVEKYKAGAAVRLAKVQAGQQSVASGHVRGHPGRWPNKTAFLLDPDRPHDLTSTALADMAGISDRQARRWLAADRNGRG